jgi:hypothetical protein
MTAEEPGETSSRRKSTRRTYLVPGAGLSRGPMAHNASRLVDDRPPGPVGWNMGGKRSHRKEKARAEEEETDG